LEERGLNSGGRCRFGGKRCRLRREVGIRRKVEKEGSVD